MNQRSKSTMKEKFEQQLDQTRAENEELMRLRLSKKKMDLNGRFEKKDVHNLLNSLLQGEVIEEDLFNQFWTHYFRINASLKDVINAYNSAMMMLIEKTARNNHRIGELGKERERLKQNHDFKNVNLVNLDLETLETETAQYRQDLRELSKPFQFNFAPLIETLTLSLAKTALTNKTLEPSRSPSVDGHLDVMRDVLELIARPEQEAPEEQPSEEVQLTSEEKYHRFTVYLACIALVVDLSMAFNKFNFLDLIIGTIFAGNSLLEDYLLKNDLMNRIVEKIELNFIEDKLTVRDAYVAEDVKKAAEIREDRHNFDIYANSSFIMLAVVVLWDILWLFVMNGGYYECEGAGFSVQTDSFSFWKYNRYILYASIYTAISKAVMLIFMVQMAALTPQRIFTRHNLAIFMFRFTDINEVINSLIYAK